MEINMSEVKHYLEQMVDFRKRFTKLPEGFQYVCFEDYVLQNGRVLESSALTEEEEAVVQAAIDRALKMGHDVTEMKQCFSNAQLLVICDHSDELIYHEGFAVGRSIVVHHGWVTINGKVVDSTWKVKEPTSRSFLPQHPVGELPQGYVYLGVAIENEDYISHRISHREIVGSLLDDWEGGYPLLRGIDPNDDESACEFYDAVQEAEDEREETG
jgi:hypothetical protein